jgi:predicted nucleic acid-binding protein
MTLLVIDASVVVKWFVPEIYDAEAKRLLNPANQFVAPDLLFAEIANVMSMKVRRGDLPEEKAQRMVSELHAIPVATVPCRQLANETCILAMATGRSAYDAMYLALAVILNTRLVTADQRLANAIRLRPLLAPHIQFIADTP